MAKDFQFYKQLDTMDCGATCLRMIARYYGHYYSLEYLRALTHQNVHGASLLGISDAAEQIGMHTVGARIPFSRLIDDIPLPCIVHWRNDHFVVVIKANNRSVTIADPADGIHKISRDAFLENWVGSADGYDREGVILLLEPTADFYEREGQKANKSSFRYVWQNILQYKGLLWRLGLGVVIGSILFITFPFMVKAIVDEGIGIKDYNLVLLIMVAWLALYLGQMFLEVIRSLILLHIGSKVNMSLLTDFMIKILKLPPRFFHGKMTDDIIQRLYDNSRVERFLATESLSVVFSGFTLLLFSIVLWHFDVNIFLVFVIFTCLHFLWVVAFLKKRRDLDYKRYDQAAETHHKVTDLVRGMEEIKLNNAEKKMRWSWERSEARLYRLSRKYFMMNDLPRMGAEFLNDLKNIIIIVLAARAVIGVDIEELVAAGAATATLPEPMTLGTMVAIMFILAQLNNPIKQMIRFILAAQDAKISLERMNEVHEMENEENPLEKVSMLPQQGIISGESVYFRYDGPHSPFIIENVSFKIPYGKTTAIIGPSGSGKSTLLRLLLNFFEPTKGTIKLGDMSLINIQSHLWRQKCGVVMQEGYLFSDTIAKNIALADEVPNSQRLITAARIADIQPFIDSLPRGFNTKIGAGGIGLSEGQKQRLLIARAVYKDPEYLFLDEATNDLDPASEAVIMKNIRRYFAKKTIVIIAHKLSAVTHADHIIMLESGKVTEKGSHDELTTRRGAYYHWAKDQWNYS